jgi:tripartite-type tricarboxylate transporter receptor subunit TctC
MRSIAIAFIVGIAAFFATPVHAQQAYPSKTITLVTPFAAGAGSDILTRILAEFLTRKLGQQVIVQNVAGAGGTIGARFVAQAHPDGYTLLLHHVGMSTAPALYKDLQFDPVKSFEPIGLFADSPYMLLATPGFPPNTMKELVEYVRVHKDKVNFGTAGVGSGGHLCALLFEQAIDVKVTQLQYKGASLAVQDVLGGRVDMMCDSPPPILAHIRAGKLKAYAIMGGRRLDSMPDIPTATEAGMKTLDMMSIWYGLYAPAGTPKAIIDRLSAALQAANADPGIAAQLTKLETAVFDAKQATPDALRQRLRSQIELWTPIILKANLAPS